MLTKVQLVPGRAELLTSQSQQHSDKDKTIKMISRALMTRLKKAKVIIALLIVVASLAMAAAVAAHPCHVEGPEYNRNLMLFLNATFTGQPAIDAGVLSGLTEQQRSHLAFNPQGFVAKCLEEGEDGYDCSNFVKVPAQVRLN